MEGNGVVIQATGADLDQRAADMAPRNGKKRQRKEPSTPTVDRPSRERRSVDRFVASAEKEVKEFKIDKGSGTILKDIPNVVYKLSKRKGSDEIVQLLHRILFGKQAKSHLAKTNILQFSGYVWGGNEEKEKAKVKEKLEKCVKENLIQMSELLDLNIFKSSKKEDAVVKLLEFLESPYQTTEKLIEEKVKESKMKKIKKRLAKEKKKTTGKTPQKKQKKDSMAEVDKEDSDKEVDADSSSDAEDNEETNVKFEDTSDYDNDGDDDDDDGDDDGDDDYDAESKGSKKRNSTKSATKKSTQPSNEEDCKVEVVSSGKKTTPEVKANQSKAEAKEVSEPNDEELQIEIRELLKNADFTTVTFADILRQLGKKFGLEVFSNKAHVKSLIQAEIAVLTEGGDEDSENEDDRNVEIENNADGGKTQEGNEGEEAGNDGEIEGVESVVDHEGENDDGDIENNGGDDDACAANETNCPDDDGTKNDSKREESVSTGA